jgi:hypothetical protein
MRCGLSFLPAARFSVLLLAFCLLPAVLARADAVGVPVTLSVTPASVKQGDQEEAILKTVVTLQGPSPDYFICEVRSEDKRKVSCTDIIFKKGDTEGVGLATVFWSRIDDDCKVKITARNIETPDTVVSFTISLQVKEAGQ